MNKLRNKSFYTIFIILSVFSLTILLIFNVQDYKSQLSRVGNALRTNNIFRPLGNKNIPNNQELPLMRFMDSTVYSVTLDNKNNIKSITSHTREGDVPEDLMNQVNLIIASNKKTYIGNLYYEKYSYRYVNSKNLIIVDNSTYNKKLTESLKVSVLILVVTEIIAYIIARKLSNWMSKPVEDAFQKQKDFVADASHELKTPLAVIMASADALEKNSKEKKWLKNIQNESERMNKLITNLLDLSKIENINAFEIVDLSKLIEKSILTLESIMYENNIELKYNIEDNITLNCNSDEMKQLVSILLDNAIKHSNKKGTIEVNLSQEKNNVLFEVKNTGKEIDPEEEEKIFERFYRVDKSRNREENRYGLGLAIAKAIVTKHNGTIKAHSQDGWTTFTVNIKKK